MSQIEHPAHVLWLDVETTGLDPRTHEIIEIAAIITNPQLEVKSEQHFLVKWTKDSWNLWCAENHKKSGLVDEIRQRGVFLSDAMNTITSAVRMACNSKPKSVTLAGRTVHFDRAFLSVHAPELEALLHHRHLDVSSIEMFLQRCGVKTKNHVGTPPHRALDDVKYAIEEYKYYRDLIESHMRGVQP